MALPHFIFKFSEIEMAPLREFEKLVLNDSVIRYFYQHSLLEEQILRWQAGQAQASVLAMAAGEFASRTRTAEERHAGMEAEAGTTKTYVITYYNPETHKAEVLETKSHIVIKDDAKRIVEEALGMQSFYPIYAFIGSPLVKQEVLPWKLEQILSEREYATPPPASGGASVVPVRLITQTQVEIVAARRQAEIVKVSIAEAMRRKEKAELLTDEEIVLLGEAVEALRKGGDAEKALDRLPPLSRVRYLAVLRMKRIGTQALLQMIIRDTTFLKTVKKKLQVLGFEDLVGIVRLLRNLRKRK